MFQIDLGVECATATDRQKCDRLWKLIQSRTLPSAVETATTQSIATLIQE
ncbi:hypothetical protein QUA70_02420 [Microcoleus sp. LAD1_D5]